MALNKNFLPIFNIGNDLSAGLRTVKVAEALATGWYKGQVDYHLRKAGLVTLINGQEYYTPAYGTLYYSANFFNKGTAGWHVAEFFKLVGITEDDLRQIWYTAYSGNVDGIYQLWRAKNDMSPLYFKREVERLSEKISNIDLIEIDYENQMYKKSIYTTESSRVYNPKSSIYGDELRWGQKQGSYNTERKQSVERNFTLEPVINNSTEYCFGKEIRVYSSGINVTDSFDDETLFAIQSMIAYSGSSFMDRISYSKKSESEIEMEKYSLDGNGVKEVYVKVLGIEQFSGVIKEGFRNDEENIHYIRYTGIPIKNDVETIIDFIEDKTKINGRTQLQLTGTVRNEILFYFTEQFWKNFGNQANGISTMLYNATVNEGDEFLFYDLRDPNLGAFMNVKAFRKLSLKEIGEYFSIYFDIKTTSPKGSWFDGFMGFLAEFLGKIHDIAFKEMMLHPVMKATAQLLTKFGNHVLSKDLTKEEYGRQVSGVVVAIIGTIFSWGTMTQLAVGVGVALATAGSEAEGERKKAESEADVKKARDEQRKEEDKKQKEKEAMRERINSESSDSEDDAFRRFLKDPMYKISDEKKEMENSFKSQFKLL